ncbi:MAG: hypothetical protein COX81_01315 [Candidatus Magasanikbacteria bacterium CG_4_10_14_0_2_um_filter_37_12]|uniref:Lipoprotein SmpA/OmlA domain-containing protein n=1 Tax=Candidatus Magasanikbacteria bacterium CG_4_10_14_0_2_um_filter_37_12 TaxID=1974637 RepID=A0A2M7V8T9_9BACT|nr:MAG: hypothetical protein COX81_01315 [Candidatus Magasanikbacteria bacterium CG_4_10_14_0_2_um_filter_37_12]
MFVFLSLWFLFNKGGSFEDANFDSEKWIGATDVERGTMAHDVVENKLFTGKTKEELVVLLGEPNYTSVGTERWFYSIGQMRSVGTFIRENYTLAISFSKDLMVDMVRIEEEFY